ncbi:MAG: hypothetical protein DI626_08550 [Micavibrio aeruginosavorus]|uniref:ResB-like domain-containing protein n=1 Tax=Micavibrio aeruginosavorus TaxID=349221 RepID=A0A2W4ZTN3_9BACT|nr:MAG: hypothetical protein DI626_08550 [Micavibrio aeruginosavorus]
MENTAVSKSGLREGLSKMASPSILLFALPWLMILLTIGTVAQKEMGLFQAQQMFFSSWILWLGPFPLPGTYTTLAFITACLLSKFLLFSPWRIGQAGIILTHLGVLVLLLGGMVTALTQKEGFIAIREGESASAVSDYHARILKVRKNGEDFIAAPFETLEKGTKIEGLPFELSVRRTCDNCRVVPTKEEGSKGFAENISLRDGPLEKEAEANLSGVDFAVSGAGGDQDGHYIVMEDIPHTPEITAADDSYKISIGRAERPLPFAIKLNDFRREMHPGTNMAKGFASDIVVQDADAEWPYTISMNEPMRYKGYTFYQSSFSIRPDGEYTILSAVENKGRIFPYLASAIIFAGLLLHIILRLLGRGRDAA